MLSNAKITTCLVEMDAVLLVKLRLAGHVQVLFLQSAHLYVGMAETWLGKYVMMEMH